MRDLIILGGGPAGAAAAVYVGRKKLDTLLISESFGGQSVVSDDIQNWLGEESVSGLDLAKKLERHARAQKSVELKIGARIKSVGKTDEGFFAETDDGARFEAKAIIVALGSHHRKLDVPGEKEFSGRGVFYCAICDAPLMQGKAAAVIGGGNAGLEAAVDLLPYADKIYLLVRSDRLKGDAVTQDKIKASDKAEIIFNATIKEITGNKFVSGLKYAASKTGEEKKLDVAGVFVEVGLIPSSEPVKDLVKLNDRGEIVIDHRTCATSQPGIWAAGDVTDVKFRQNNISAGDGVKAALSANEFLSGQK